MNNRALRRTVMVIVMVMVMATLVGIASAANEAAVLDYFEKYEGPNYIQLDIGNEKAVAVRDQQPTATYTFEVGERVLASQVKGHVAALLTTQRFLATSTDIADWRSYELGIDEPDGSEMSLSPYLVLLMTNSHAVVFDGHNGRFISYEIPLGETVAAKGIAPQVAAFATEYRVVAFAQKQQVFREMALDLDETIRDLQVTPGLVTVKTSERLLTFRADDGVWRTRDINE